MFCPYIYSVVPFHTFLLLVVVVVVVVVLVVMRGGGVQALTCQPVLRRAADASGRTRPSRGRWGPQEEPGKFSESL